MIRNVLKILLVHDGMYFRGLAPNLRKNLLPPPTGYRQMKHFKCILYLLF